MTTTDVILHTCDKCRESFVRPVVTEEQAKATPRVVILCQLHGVAFSAMREALEAAKSLLENIGKGNWTKTPAYEKCCAALALTEQPK